MGLVLRRGALAVVAGLVLAAAVPAMASAAVSLKITSGTGFPAAGHPTIVNTIGLSGGAASSSTLKLAPGVLASLTSNPACLAANTHTAECQVGDGKANPGLGSESLIAAYLVPPTSPTTNVAGIDLVVAAPIGPATIHGELNISQIANGNVQGTLILGPTAAGLAGITLSLDGTLPGGSHAGAPFTQMPTNCATPNPHSHLDVAYLVPESADASPDVAPTGCSSLAYTPDVSATAVRDSTGSGVALTTVITQPAGQANNGAASLSIPAATLSPNPTALGGLCAAPDPHFSNCTPVGAAKVETPLVPVFPSSPLQNGKVYLAQVSGAPAIVVHFGAPFEFNLVGTFGSTLVTPNPKLTFASLPDLPISKLSVGFSGGPNSTFVSSCTVPTSTLTAKFTGQNGIPLDRTPSFTVQNCPAVITKPGKPTVSGASLNGVGKRKATLKFKVNAGSNAPKVKSFSVKLPGGMGFTKKFKKGVKVTCGGKFTASKSGKTVKVTMKTAATQACLKLTSKALTVTKGLAKKVKKHKVKKLKFTVKITDAKGAVTTIPLKLSV